MTFEQFKQAYMATEAEVHSVSDEQVLNKPIAEPDWLFWVVLLLAGFTALLIGCLLASYGV